MQGITSSIQLTFEVLANPSNLACIPVLSHALTSSNDDIRQAAVKALLSRGQPEDFGVILDRIDRCKEPEIALLMQFKNLLMVAVEAGLADRSEPERIQQAIIAIGKLTLEPLFPHLLQIVEDNGDPQQLVAIEVLMGLATRFGAIARSSQPKPCATRDLLILEIEKSMDRFDDHHVRQVVDAWLTCVRWDDAAFRTLWNDRTRTGLMRLVQHPLKTSIRPFVIELCLGVLWGRDSDPAAVELILNRNDYPFLKELSEWIDRLGISPALKKNLAHSAGTALLPNLNFSDQELPTHYRASILQLLPLFQTSPDRMLNAANTLLRERDPRAHEPIINALRSYRSLTPEMTVMALSDGLDIPNPESPVSSEPALPPWKESLRNALRELFELHASQPEPVQEAIESLFATFSCDELLRHLNDWPEAHLHAYASVLVIAKENWINSIEREFKSPSAIKRSQAIRALRVIGRDEWLKPYAMNGLSDEDERVREQAVHALADHKDSEEVMRLIEPLLLDDIATVMYAAQQAIEKLERTKSTSESESQP